MVKEWIRCGLAVCVIFLSSFAFAEVPDSESITLFSSYIVVNKDASIDISETITVYSLQQSIKHGIVRRLPIRYTDSYGITHRTHYNIKQITTNDVNTDYSTQLEGNQMAVYIGDPDGLLAPGFYTFNLRYEVQDAVNFLKDGDELYWNITGNQWNFPIQRAEATIELPAEATILNYTGYTGAMGQKEHQFVVNKAAPNRILFTTSTSLPPGSGLTIAVAWQKGIVTPPTWIDKLKAQILPTTSESIALGIGVLVFLYFLGMWKKYGKDPRRGTIIPLFEPPSQLSPASVRYINRMHSDDKGFTAAIISLATKGHVLIEQKANVVMLYDNKKETKDLPEDEKSVMKALFSAGPSLVINQSYAETIQKAQTGLALSLKKMFGNQYFNTNFGYFVNGALVSIFAVIILILGANDSGQAFFALVWLGVWTIGCFYLVKQAWKNLQSAFQSGGRFFKAIGSSLFALPFLIGEVVGLYIFMDSVHPVTLLLLLCIVVLNIVFYMLLKAPTVEGRKVMDQIEGFKLYLSTAERHRLDQLNPPEKTPALFEKYLPYAIALDVENAWSEQFNDVLAAAGTESHPYQPTWYRGNAFNAATIGSFPSFLNSSLNNALSSTSVSSSSSASGGGGSSGGGGGGGGGGGW